MISPPARKALALLAELAAGSPHGHRGAAGSPWAIVGARTRRGQIPYVEKAAAAELEAAGLAELLEARRVFVRATDAGLSFPLAEVALFGASLEVIESSEADVDRARRARNAAAARLAEKLSLSELAEVAGVSKARVHQWATEGREEATR